MIDAIILTEEGIKQLADGGVVFVKSGHDEKPNVAIMSEATFDRMMDRTYP